MIKKWYCFFISSLLICILISSLTICVTATASPTVEILSEILTVQKSGNGGSVELVDGEIVVEGNGHDVFALLGYAEGGREIEYSAHVKLTSASGGASIIWGVIEKEVVTVGWCGASLAPGSLHGPYGCNLSGIQYLPSAFSAPTNETEGVLKVHISTDGLMTYYFNDVFVGEQQDNGIYNGGYVGINVFSTGAAIFSNITLTTYPEDTSITETDKGPGTEDADVTTSKTSEKLDSESNVITDKQSQENAPNEKDTGQSGDLGFYVFGAIIVILMGIFTIINMKQNKNN